MLTSLTHPLVKRLVKLRECSKERKKSQSALVEGKKMVEELSEKRVVLNCLAREASLFPLAVPKKACHLVTQALIDKVAGSNSPEGIVAEVAMPEYRDLSSVRRLLVLDAVSDPGNLGTLIRTAYALGWDGAYLTEGSCDPFNDKALRAAKGATFHLPLEKGEVGEIVKRIKNGAVAYAADLHGEVLTVAEKEKEEALILILGNESHGVSKTLVDASKRLLIPMKGEMESLNVAAAGAILLWSLR